MSLHRLSASALDDDAPNHAPNQAANQAATATGLDTVVFDSSTPTGASIQFTEAMAIARGAATPSFPSRSRATTPTRPHPANQALHPFAAIMQQQTAPQQTSFADFSQFRGSSDSLLPPSSDCDSASATPTTPSKSPSKPSPTRLTASSLSSASLPFTPITPTLSSSRSTSPSSKKTKDTSSAFEAPLLSAQPTHIESLKAGVLMVTKRWINPIHFHEVPAIDGVVDLVQKSFSFNEGARPVRRLLTLHDAQMKLGKSAPREHLLALLVESRSWRAAAQLASSVIPTLSPHSPADICHWWFVRFVALEKLRFLDVLAVEVDVLQPGEALVSVGSAYGADVNSAVASGMVKNPVSWEVRVFWAREPTLRGFPKEALDRVYGLILECVQHVNKAVDDKEKDQQKDRIRNLNLLAVDLLVEMRDFRLASIVLTGLINAPGQTPDVTLLSALLRLKLQVGDIHESNRIAGIIERTLLLPEHTSTTIDATVLPSNHFAQRDVILMNRALLAIASKGDWPSATTYLQELLAHLQHESTSTPFPRKTTQRNSIPIAVNNLAVAHLYTGHAAQSLAHLESLAVEMPAVVATCGPLLFNLATLYDLVDASLERKKRLLGSVVAVSGGDDLDAACLKLG
ncbi:hypothetical protein BC830DRAFT_1259747 [Chytriomyces sp. MP71]|nr:hypothetical protein BC830DRAFT_1259747 [Chytriomyces sp. MP71]